MMKNRRAIVMAGLFLAACTSDQPATETAQKASTDDMVPEVVIRTKDYSFDAPDTIYSGANRIRLINDGPDLHHVWLLRLEQGKTADDLFKVMSKGEGPLPSWAVDVGGPNTPGRPGGENTAIVDLGPGNYIMLCVIPCPIDGQLRLLALHPDIGALLPALVVRAGLEIVDAWAESQAGAGAGPALEYLTHLTGVDPGADAIVLPPLVTVVARRPS